MDMGETALDEDTFDEYLSEVGSHYTADKVSSCMTGFSGNVSFSFSTIC